jgi:hypothetical protein
MALASHDLSGATSESITNTFLPIDYPPPSLTPDGHWMVYLTVNAIVQNPQGSIPTGQGDNYYLYDTTSPNSVSNNTLITRQFGTTNQDGNAGPDAFTTTTAPPAAVSANRALQRNCCAVFCANRSHPPLWSCARNAIHCKVNEINKLWKLADTDVSVRLGA